MIKVDQDFYCSAQKVMNILFASTNYLVDFQILNSKTAFK